MLGWSFPKSRAPNPRLSCGVSGVVAAVAGGSGVSGSSDRGLARGRIGCLPVGGGGLSVVVLPPVDGVFFEPGSDGFVGGSEFVPGGGSYKVNVWPVAVSFTSVSTDPSGLRVDLITFTFCSGWPSKRRVMVSFGFGNSGAAGLSSPALDSDEVAIATPASNPHTHRFHTHRDIAGLHTALVPCGRP